MSRTLTTLSIIALLGLAALAGGARQRLGLAERLRQLDRDGDGAISKAEVEAMAGTGGMDGEKAPDPGDEMKENDE